mmetsp:Transcript_21342/g.43925  ORF Transcript_21342/g.43925 Transcript_21342/m.43925 type:complete len:108 (+) Transcript_21342:178-501(+)
MRSILKTPLPIVLLFLDELMPLTIFFPSRKSCRYCSPDRTQRSIHVLKAPWKSYVPVLEFRHFSIEISLYIMLIVCCDELFDCGEWRNTKVLCEKKLNFLEKTEKHR